ncbi:MAG: hypothetical protein LBS84_09850 [Clostridiales bacterium]|jgi:hypothetical protein|nr:hypothetical protein [Clostridiales bacterium]
METVIKDYYHGFEGSPEIQFIRVLKNGENNTLRIWDGYFDDIMQQIKPEKNGWTDIAYYYHMETGWYSDSPWKIPVLSNTLELLRQRENKTFNFPESKEVCGDLCSLLEQAIAEDELVFIAYD